MISPSRHHHHHHHYRNTRGKVIDPDDIHLILTEQPYQLPQLSTNTDQIIFEEYGFNKYYRCIALV